MTYMTIQLENGKYLSGDLIGELVTDIVNKFARLVWLMMKQK